MRLKFKSLMALATALLFIQSSLFSQDVVRCGTMENLKEEMDQDPSLKERRKQLEKDIQDYINSPLRETDNDTVIIPIVFHIIHNGDALGTNENIADIYIEAQLNQLNDDFRRMNSDADAVWPQAADTWIEFCLASVDPDGNSTTGIIRHNITGGPWGQNSFNSTVKPSTIWDRDNYLNFWSANLSGSLLGYAQFPGGNASTDGIVCLYSSVGSIDTPNPVGGNYDIGRTATHEVGHWLNLFHIWGDDGTSCNGSDSCADTPNQAGSTSGCPNGVQTDNCAPSSPGYMYQNYMDYSYDDCMNIFTVGQRDRMQACLNTSRLSLKTASCGEDSPVADFSPDSGTEILCGASPNLSFTDLSTGGADAWSWTFSGAGVSPTSSTDANPTVTVSSSGNLIATLTATITGAGSDTHTGTVVIDLRPLSDPICIASPCLDFDAGPYTSFNYADACAVGACAAVVSAEEVHENEAYTLAGLIGGLDYTFEFCNGYTGSNWDGVITVGEYDSVTDAAVPNSEIVAEFGCTVSFTAPFDGDFIVVVSGVNNCGGSENTTDNGAPSFTCDTDCVSQCGMLFTDNGGVGFNYENNQNKTYLICPDDPTCEVVEVAFTSFDLNGNNDILTAYDGDDISATLLGRYRNSANPGTLISTHASGCLTFVFSNDASGTDPGWEANVTCIDDGTCTNCPSDYAGANALSGSENGSGGMNADGDFETDGAIESTQTITGGTVDYDSSISIEMESGFEISVGAEVDIFIDGCDNGGGGNTLVGNDGEEDKRLSSAKKTSRKNREKE